jgi:glycosyltransferase involved in cell wall biosynthesis
VRTIQIFLTESPLLIFSQNPSIVLAWLCVIYGKLSRIPVVVDAHNAGIYPPQGKWLSWFAAHLLRVADFTMVTNHSLAEHVARAGGRPLILPDPIPTLEFPGAATNRKKLKGKFNVLFVCTFASDEPYLEVIKAAGLLDPEIYVYITGDSKGKDKEYRECVPANIIFTGYLPEEDYVQMLFSVDVIVDLTTRPDCLVCGAYEAVAAGAPLIVSNSEALRRHFSMGTLFTDNTSGNLAAKINAAISARETLAQQMGDLKVKLSSEWTRSKAECERVLDRQVR